MNEDEQNRYVDKLLKAIGPHEDSPGFPTVEELLRVLVARLPEASVVKALESVMRKRGLRNPAGYVLRALRSELDERILGKGAA